MSTLTLIVLPIFAQNVYPDDKYKEYVSNKKGRDFNIDTLEARIQKHNNDTIWKSFNTTLFDKSVEQYTFEKKELRIEADIPELNFCYGYIGPDYYRRDYSRDENYYLRVYNKNTWDLIKEIKIPFDYQKENFQGQCVMREKIDDYFWRYEVYQIDGRNALLAGSYIVSTFDLSLGKIHYFKQNNNTITYNYVDTDEYYTFSFRQVLEWYRKAGFTGMCISKVGCMMGDGLFWGIGCVSQLSNSHDAKGLMTFLYRDNGNVFLFCEFGSTFFSGSYCPPVCENAYLNYIRDLYLYTKK